METFSFDLLADLARRIAGMNLHLVGFSVLTTIGLFLLDLLCLGWDKSSVKRILVNPSRSAQLDIALGFLYLLNFMPFLGTILSFGIGHYIPMWVQNTFGLNMLSFIPTVWGRAIFYLLLFDLLFYWKHRLTHRYTWWWQIHEVHHSATELNIITANRLHPLDEALFRIFTCLPLAIAGAPPEVYLYIRALLVVHVKLTHSLLPWNWGWFGRYFLIAPAAHRIHHSDLPHHRDHNFGNFLPWWDHLFGTWKEPVPGEDWKADDRPHYNHGTWYGDLWNAYLRFWRHLIPSTKTAPGSHDIVWPR